MTDYSAYQEELLRSIADSLGLSYEQLQGRTFYGGGFRGGKTYAQRQATMKEINPRPEPKRERTVELFKDPANGPDYCVYVRFPTRGLDDGVLYGPNGYPENVGPTPDGPAQWRTAKEALEHFQRVYEFMEDEL